MWRYSRFPEFLSKLALANQILRAIALLIGNFPTQKRIWAAAVAATELSWVSLRQIGAAEQRVSSLCARLLGWPEYKQTHRQA